MTIPKFCKIIAKAKREFELSDGSYNLWLAYYEIKRAAYGKLLAKIPEVAGIDHIWTLLYGYSPSLWEELLQSHVDHIKNGLPCVDCGKKVKFPAVRCDECLVAHKKLIEEQREVAKKLKKKKRNRR